MKTLFFRYLCLLLLLVLVSATTKGVDPNEDKYASASKTFECFDKSKTIPVEFVNDGYCDCENDGSDEPGTSACSSAKASTKFYCINKGYLPTYISSSFVNDGICDCCDGSDEYDGKVFCPNKCDELGREVKADMQKKIVVIKRALATKTARAKNARTALDVKRKELMDKQDQLKTMEEELTELLLIKQDQERLEDIERSLVREKALQEEQKKKQIENELYGTTEQQSDQPKTGDEQLNPASEPSEVPFGEEKTEKTDKPEQVDPVYEAAKNFKSEVPTNPFSFDNIKQQLLSSYHSLSVQYYETLQYIYGTFNPTAAEKARSAYTKKDSDINNLKKEIEELEKIFRFDYGPDSEYYDWYKRCFEYDARDYRYEFCPFEKTAQKERQQTYGGTNLGTWGKWADGSNYTIQKFENGQGCWNGPARSCDVTLICGLEEKLFKADEPSRCVYALTMETPLACKQADLQALENKFKAYFEN